MVWTDDRDGNGKYEIMARGFDPDGRERFGEISVNAGSAGQQLNPSVATDSAGNFVVAWEDDRNTNGVCEIRVRGFNADGRPRFAELKPNTVSRGQQRMPDVAMGPRGDFVVVWADNRDRDQFYSILARGFAAGGAGRFSETIVARSDHGWFPDVPFV